MKIYKRGFTLVEILVVIAILGVLTFIVVNFVQGARERSRDAERMSDIRQINTAIELYINANGKAPDLGDPGCINVQNYDASCFASSGQGLANWNTLATQLAPYIKILPSDPCPTCTAQALFARQAYAAEGDSEYVYQTVAAVNAYLQSKNIDPVTMGVNTQSYSVYASELEGNPKAFGFGPSVPTEPADEDNDNSDDEGGGKDNGRCPYNTDEICKIWENCADGNAAACSVLPPLGDECPYRSNETCELWDQCEKGDIDACKALPEGDEEEKCPFDDNKACEIWEQCNAGNKEACDAIKK